MKLITSTFRSLSAQVISSAVSRLLLECLANLSASCELWYLSSGLQEPGVPGPHSHLLKGYLHDLPYSNLNVWCKGAGCFLSKLGGLQPVRNSLQSLVRKKRHKAKAKAIAGEGITAPASPGSGLIGKATLRWIFSLKACLSPASKLSTIERQCPALMNNASEEAKVHSDSDERVRIRHRPGSLRGRFQTKLFGRIAGNDMP